MNTTMERLHSLLGDDTFRFTLESKEANDEYGERAKISFYIESNKHTCVISRPSNKSWAEINLDLVETYTATMLLHPEHKVYQLIIHGVHRNNTEEVKTMEDTIEVTRTQHITAKTNVRDLPREFTSFVEIVNMEVTNKSMYVTINGKECRVTLPAHINAEEINNKVVGFYIKGARTLMVADNLVIPLLTVSSVVGDTVIHETNECTVVESQFMPDSTFWFKLVVNITGEEVTTSLPLPVKHTPILTQTRFLVGDIITESEGIHLIILDVSTILFNRTIYLLKNEKKGIEFTLDEVLLEDFAIVVPRTTEDIWEEVEALHPSESAARERLAEEYMITHREELDKE